MSTFSQFFPGSGGGSSGGVGSLVTGWYPNDPTKLICDGLSTAPAPNAELGHMMPSISSAAMNQIITNTTAFHLAPQSVAYGNGLWVVTGQFPNGNGTTAVATSTDGVSWTLRDISGANFLLWHSVTWTGRMFLAGGDDNGSSTTYIARSLDGLAWDVRFAQNTTGGAQVFISSGSRIVALPKFATSTYIYSDDDGITWGLIPGLPTSVGVVGGAFHAGRFVYVTTSGRHYGRDGFAWSTGTAPTGTQTGLASNGTILVASSSSSNATATSTDGVTWTTRTVGGLGAVTWTGSQFFAMGYGNALVWTSPDGITWTSFALPTSFTTGFAQLAASGTQVLGVDPQVTTGPYELTTTTQVVRALPRAWGNPGAATAFSCTAYASTLGLWAATATSTDGQAGGVLVTSPDGDVWTQRAVASTSGALTYLAASPTAFVGVMSAVTNAFAYSADGVAWRTVTLPTSGTWTGLAYGNGVFVAVSSSSTWLSSPDGITWTIRAGQPISNARGIAHNGTLFCAYGAGGEICTSTTGTGVFTSQTTQGNPIYYMFAHGSTFVGTIANQASLYTSTTATGVWATRTLGAALANPVGASTGSVSVVGQVSSTYFSSPDAITWTSRQQTEGGYTPTAFGGAPGGGLVAFAVNSHATVSGTDGINWRTRTVGNFQTSGAINGTLTAGGLTLAGHNGGGGMVSVLSDGGTNWRQYRLPVLNAGTSFTALGYGAGVYVAAGQASGLTSAATSTDGIRWTRRTMPDLGSTLGRWVKIVYGAGTFVAVSNTTTYATSPDGITWTARNAPLLPGGYNSCLAFGAGLFVLLPLTTATTTTLGTYATSPDGATWTIRTMPSGYHGAQVVSSGTSFVMSLYSNFVILRSSDGLTWSPSTNANVGGAQGISSLTWTGSVFAASLSSSPVAISRTGEAWSFRGNGGATTAEIGCSGGYTTLTLNNSGSTQFTTSLLFDPTVVKTPALSISGGPSAPFYQYYLVIA